MISNKKEGWGSADGARQIDEGMKGHIYKEVKNIDSKSHPLNEMVKLTFLLTKKDDDVDVTIIHAIVPKGADIPEHTHEVHDIIYPVSGKAKIWIQGIGDLKLEKGVLVNVPPRVLHKVYDVSEDLEVFDVFSGPIL
jgi:quercetin dioxygenase-like cupin family protein